MDPVKANTNLSKHGLDFERTATLFLEPVAPTIPDGEHSKTELRWITLSFDGLRWDSMDYAGKGCGRPTHGRHPHFRVAV